MRVIHGNTQLGNPLISVVMGLVSGSSAGSAKATDAFLSAQNQIAAEDLAAQRSRRWAMFGGLAVGAAALAGVIYLARSR